MNEQKQEIIVGYSVRSSPRYKKEDFMDIEMIQFTGLLSIMLLLGWILIMIVFLIIIGYVDKGKKEKNIKH